MNILDHEASVKSAFLHPGGKEASRHLPAYLRMKVGDLLLEIGCGTGATIALLAAERGVQIIGLDRSLAMLRAAKKPRLGQPAQHFRLVQANAGQILPFIPGRFDGIYAESVFVFLPPEAILTECLRLLRPGGSLVFTERVWKPKVTQPLARSINERSRTHFGIPAATPQPLNKTDWCNLLSAGGFHLVDALPVDSLIKSPGWPKAHLRERGRRLLQRARQPRTLIDSLRYRLSILKTLDFDQYLESFVFIARKPV